MVAHGAHLPCLRVERRGRRCGRHLPLLQPELRPKSSHFYAPRGLGCESTIAGFPDWTLEDDKLFAALLPDASGACPAATLPVYRLYNNGQGGAPNHRFVTSLDDRQTMLGQGWIAEGAGIGVGMCVPSTVGSRTTAEGLWRGVTSQGQTLRILILSGGTFHITFSQVGNALDAGVLVGTLTSANGTLTSNDVQEYPLTVPAPFAGGTTSTLRGTYVPGSSMQLTIGSSTVSATYDPAYDRPADLASFAGTYAGSTGHVTESLPMTASMDAQGKLRIQGTQCVFQVVATPHGNVNVLDINVTSGTCYRGGGVMFYDEAAHALVALSPVFINPNFGIADLWFSIGTRQ